MGEPDATAAAGDSTRAAAVGGLALVAAQLVLVLLVVRDYEVGYRLHLFPVLCVAAGGWLVHAALPPRFRLAFFCLLSLVTICFVLGWADGAIVIGIGSGLIALCHLPAPFALRASAVAFVGGALALFRLDVSQTFWPVLGSMFMFRLIVYLHELRREARRPPLAITAAYFFPFQNVCFLFFPIVDFRTLRDTYRPDADWRFAQGGLVYVVRGLSHLLAYRVVKYYVLPSPHQLGDAPTAALFLAANYALYLHVSGYFHIITGLFRLFGFGLPRTHHNYFLASSFTDIWRRINIPWKEFVAKLFFFPAFFAARRLGTRTAVVVAALWAFAVTWALHAYQVFWLTGRLPVRGADAVLWLVVGALVAWNIRRDLARAREPRPAPDTSARAAALHAARVVGMFALVSFFWACWSTPSFLFLLRTQVTNAEWLATAWPVAVVAAGLIAVGAVAKWIAARPRLANFEAPPVRVAVAQFVILAAVVAVGRPEVAEELGATTARKIGELQRESVTPVEAARAVQGYYEEIADTPVRAGAWLEEIEGRAPPRQTQYTDMTRPADDLLEQELIPGWRGELAGRPISVNQFGMRDRPDRVREKAPGVRRIVVVGSSVVMGYGVADDETFPHLSEAGLNARRAPGAPRYEVLNFGTGKSFAIHRRVLLDRKVIGFDPDVVYIVAHQDEFLGPVPHLTKLVANGTELPYPGLREVVRKAGVTAETPPGEAQAKFQPLAPEIVLAVYRDLADECRRRGIFAAWVYVPMPGVAEPAGLKAELVRTAERAGLVVVDLSDWADGRKPAEVKLSEADRHPNALGQRLIADRLLDAVRRRPELLGGAP
ncbi:hypothetical protein J8F10_03720 [Gemmata sp. G18]|uniref:SGNH hydrolase-type esterase domain-containing protein n=1 Tax=Gemmata palustris TaxID=2822762 RepID=A0ABS5BL25_9BACT|nr:hypothetical protein [Gemmata palustris]MBP3954398.1 hypothetical protein [Gemmata palustris]